MLYARPKPSKWARTLREHCASPETWDWAKAAGKSYPKAWKALGDNVPVRADILGAIADDHLRETYVSTLLRVWTERLNGRSYGTWFSDTVRKGFTPRARTKIERELAKLLALAKAATLKPHASTMELENYHRLVALDAFVRLIYCAHWQTWGKLLQKMWASLPWIDRPKFKEALEAMERPSLPK